MPRHVRHFFSSVFNFSFLVVFINLSFHSDSVPFMLKLFKSLLNHSFVALFHQSMTFFSRESFKKLLSLISIEIDKNKVWTVSKFNKKHVSCKCFFISFPASFTSPVSWTLISKYFLSTLLTSHVCNIIVVLYNNMSDSAIDIVVEFSCLWSILSWILIDLSD